MLVEERAYAKINLALDVFDKRPDEYHEVKMVMQSINLFDNISITESDCLHVQTVGAELPDDERNIAFKAAQAICHHAGIKPTVYIKIEKKIPLGAGLAGGSTDAAAVLRGLKKFYQLAIDDVELAVIAAGIGSDVPFCLHGGTALATGRGEIVVQLPPAPVFDIVLANPGFEVSTAWVYNNYSRLLVKESPNIEKVIEAIKFKGKRLLAENIFNVLENVTAKEYTIINEIKAIMVENGAMTSLMSGSGPTVFAFAENKKAAATIAAAVQRKTDAKVWVSKTRGGAQKDE